MSYKKVESADNKEYKLLSLAQNAVTRNLTPYETSQLLKGFDKDNLRKFFFYYTLCKKGEVTNENYEEIVKEFKDKFDRSMVERYERAYSLKSSNLYNLVDIELGKENTTYNLKPR